MLLDLTDFALQEQPEDNLMVAISWAWYNGLYTMAAKPIKSLELHYTMIPSLIMQVIQCLLTAFCPSFKLSKQKAECILSNIVLFNDNIISLEFNLTHF